MLIDKALQVSDKQTVTASATSTDVIDFGQATPNTGLAAKQLYMQIGVNQAATASGAATVQFALQDSADGISFADVASTQAVPVAALKAGAQFVIIMPVQHRRYVRINYAVATGPLTAGKFNAQVVAGLQLNTHMPDSPRIA